MRLQSLAQSIGKYQEKVTQANDFFSIQLLAISCNCFPIAPPPVAALPHNDVAATQSYHP